MSRRLPLLLMATILVVAVATHWTVVLAVPYGLTAIAASRISQKGTLENRWIYPPRATEASREVVRPSPDLAYSACVFDLGDGPVRITVVPGETYTSLSLYAPNTDVVVMNAIEPIDLIVARRDQTVPEGPWRVLRTDDHRGIALQRRLAPTEAAFRAADLLRRRDRCKPVSTAISD